MIRRLCFALALVSMAALDAAAQAPASIWDGVFSAEQVERGRAHFREYCAECHGNDLWGSETAPALSGRGFGFMYGGRAVGVFYGLVSTKMPMDAPGQLPPQTYADIVSYILNFNGYPTGTAELTPDSPSLESAHIERNPRQPGT